MEGMAEGASAKGMSKEHQRHDVCKGIEHRAADCFYTDVMLGPESLI